MNNTVNVRVRRKNLVEGSLVGNVDIMEGRALARDQLDTIEAFFGCIVQAINDNNLMAGFQKSEDCEGANVANAAKKKYGQGQRRAAVSPTRTTTITNPVTSTEPPAMFANRWSNSKQQ